MIPSCLPRPLKTISLPCWMLPSAFIASAPPPPPGMLSASRWGLSCPVLLSLPFPGVQGIDWTRLHQTGALGLGSPARAGPALRPPRAFTCPSFQGDLPLMTLGDGHSLSYLRVGKNHLPS